MISNWNIKNLELQINRFSKKYVSDWNEWLETPDVDRPKRLGAILRRWQACRPNPMVRTKSESVRTGPYLEDLIRVALPHLNAFHAFDICDSKSWNESYNNHLIELWKIFENLSYEGDKKVVRNGKAGGVGISKAVLLLTEGQVGPAFDDQVRQRMGLGKIETAKQWIQALRKVSKDIEAFEIKNKTTLKLATPNEFRNLHCGRIYDMALGPGEKK